MYQNDQVLICIIALFVLLNMRIFVYVDRQLKKTQKTLEGESAFKDRPDIRMGPISTGAPSEGRSQSNVQSSMETDQIKKECNQACSKAGMCMCVPYLVDIQV